MGGLAPAAEDGAKHAAQDLNGRFGQSNAAVNRENGQKMALKPGSRTLSGLFAPLHLTGNAIVVPVHFGAGAVLQKICSFSTGSHL